MRRPLGWRFFLSKPNIYPKTKHGILEMHITIFIEVV